MKHAQPQADSQHVKLSRAEVKLLQISEKAIAYLEHINQGTELDYDAFLTDNCIVIEGDSVFALPFKLAKQLVKKLDILICGRE